MSATASAGLTPIVLAYSGGLDTSFLVPWIAEQERRPVITVTVDTGGIDAAAARALGERRSARSGPSRRTIRSAARAAGLLLSRSCAFSSAMEQRPPWPACTRCASAPSASCRHRPSRAWRAASAATSSRTAAPPPGTIRCASKGFRVCGTLAPELKVLAPVRDQAFRREEELAYLSARGLPLPPSGARYSVNRGLWGVTIGGKETPHLRRQPPG